MDWKRWRPSPAMFVAVVALIVSLSGGAYAATLITGAQIKDNSITGRDVRDSSLTGRDVRNGSLDLLDLNSATKGALVGLGPNTVTYVTSPQGLVPPGGSSSRVAAQCPAGTRVVAGGFWTGSDVNVYASAPDATGTQWVVYGQHVGAIPAPVGINAYAVCVLG